LLVNFASLSAQAHASRRAILAPQAIPLQLAGHDGLRVEATFLCSRCLVSSRQAASKSATVRGRDALSKVVGGFDFLLYFPYLLNLLYLLVSSQRRDLLPHIKRHRSAQKQRAHGKVMYTQNRSRRKRSQS
jgi:hypothetical protein